MTRAQSDEGIEMSDDSGKRQHITDAAWDRVSVDMADVYDEANDRHAEHGVMLVSVEEWDERDAVAEHFHAENDSLIVEIEGLRAQIDLLEQSAQQCASNAAHWHARYMAVRSAVPFPGKAAANAGLLTLADNSDPRFGRK